MAAPGSTDTELGILIESEMDHGETGIPASSSLRPPIEDRRVSYAQASQDFGRHQSQLATVTAFADDPQHAFLGKVSHAVGVRLNHEVTNLKAKQDILRQAGVNRTVCRREGTFRDQAPVRNRY